MISRGILAPTKYQMNGYTSTQMYQGRNIVWVKQRSEFTQNAYIAVYTWYIPSIYPSLSPSRTLSCPLRHPGSLSSLRPGCLEDPLSFGHRQAANARLRAPEWPQPRVDLVNMASFPRGPACRLAYRECRLAYLWGIVEVTLPSRKHGMRGTRPRRSWILPT